MISRSIATALTAVCASVCALTGCGGDDDSKSSSTTYSGYVYAATNDPSGNAIVRYGRQSDGVLTELDSTATGGNGIGGAVVVAGAPSPQAVDPLFSNDSLILASDHTRLFVVNAGSDTVSSFRVGKDGSLTLAGTIASGAVKPTGLALHGDLLFVSHAAPNASNLQTFGFKIGSDATLSPVTGASAGVTAATPITHTLFSPDGAHLVVVELLAGVISVYPVASDGTLGAAVHNTSAGAGPFGGAFVSDTVLLVSEVHPGMPHAGAVSSYTLNGDGSLTAIATSVGDNGDATCWLTLSGNHLFASNTTSSDVSVYTVGSNGALTLALASTAKTAANGATDFMGNATAGPVDAFVSADGKYFYQQFSGLGIVAAFTIGDDGALTAIANADGGGLPMLGSEGVDGY